MTDGPPPVYRPAGRRIALWLVLGLTGSLLACSLPALLLVSFVERSTGAPGASPTPARSPNPGDPESVVRDWARDRIGDVLTRQAAALLGGDEKGFVAVAAPKSPAVASLRQRYRSLRALKVTTWRTRPNAAPTRVTGEGGRVEWEVPVTVEHCFAVAGCVPGSVVEVTRWVDVDGAYLLVLARPSSGEHDGPRPWEVSDLAVATGKRVVVATTASLRPRLAALLFEAEAAAIVADRYAVGGRPPDRYHVFLAAEPEWKSWYGGDLPEWTAGYAVPVGGDRFDVVIRVKGLSNSGLGGLLRHEMTHAASLPGRGFRTGSNWWLIEGIADLAAAGGRPVNRYESLPEVRQLVAAGWNGPLTDAEPDEKSADWEVNAAYGVGYLSVRYLLDRFGERQLLAFFKAVVHERKSLESASVDAFGVEWTTLQDQSVAYVRSVGA